MNRKVAENCKNFAKLLNLFYKFSIFLKNIL